VAYGGWPLNGATARFVATSKRRGRPAKRRAVERRTDDSGGVVQCFHAPPPGSRRVRRVKVSATVSAVAASHPFTVSLRATR
jgi:hypothetical protein